MTEGRCNKPAAAAGSFAGYQEHGSEVGQLEPDFGEVGSVLSRMLEVNRADGTGVRVPGLEVMVSP